MSDEHELQFIRVVLLHSSERESGLAVGLVSEVRAVVRALALRDYYPFWKHRNERSRAGKLLLLDPNDHSTIQARASSRSCILSGV